MYLCWLNTCMMQQGKSGWDFTLDLRRRQLTEMFVLMAATIPHCPKTSLNLLADHQQVPSYTLEGNPSWLGVEALSNIKEERKKEKDSSFNWRYNWVSALCTFISRKCTMSLVGLKRHCKAIPTRFNNLYYKIGDGSKKTQFERNWMIFTIRWQKIITDQTHGFRGLSQRLIKLSILSLFPQLSTTKYLLYVSVMMMILCVDFVCGVILCQVLLMFLWWFKKIATRTMKIVLFYLTGHKWSLVAHISLH